MVTPNGQLDMFSPRPVAPQAPPFFRTPQVESPAVPNNPSQKDLRKDTEEWIKSNPEVAKMFLFFARELAARGRPFGVGLITERVRYECAISTSPSKFKINNNWRSYIARWLTAQDPSLEKWMSFREVKY